MAKKKTTKKKVGGAISLPIPLGRPCGQRIVRGAKAGERLGANECAFVTYALEAGVVALPQPTVAFWGPGQVIKASFGGASVAYGFVGGVVFKNC